MGFTFSPVPLYNFANKSFCTFCIFGQDTLKALLENGYLHLTSLWYAHRWLIASQFSSRWWTSPGNGALPGVPETPKLANHHGDRVRCRDGLQLLREVPEQLDIDPTDTLDSTGKRSMGWQVPEWPREGCWPDHGPCILRICNLTRGLLWDGG